MRRSTGRIAKRVASCPGCRLFVPAVPKLALPTRRRRVRTLRRCVPAVEGAAPVRIFRHPTARPRELVAKKRVKDPCFAVAVPAAALPPLAPAAALRADRTLRDRASLGVVVEARGARVGPRVARVIRPGIAVVHVSTNPIVVVADARAERIAGVDVPRVRPTGTSSAARVSSRSSSYPSRVRRVSPRRVSSSPLVPLARCPEVSRTGGCIAKRRRRPPPSRRRVPQVTPPPVAADAADACGVPRAPGARELVKASTAE